MKFFRKKKKDIPKIMKCWFCSLEDDIIHSFETQGFDSDYGHYFGENSWYHEKCFEKVKNASNFNDLGWQVQSKVKSIKKAKRQEKRDHLAEEKREIQEKKELDAWSQVKVGL